MKLLKFTLITLTCLALSYFAHAQENDTNQAVPSPPPPAISETVESSQLPNDEKEDEIFTIAQEMPSFPGCSNLKKRNKSCTDRKTLQFIESNLQYPVEARENGIEGTVIVNFVVEKDGTITNAKIYHDLGGGCGKEAIRIVESMPKWTPAKQYHQPVRLRFKLPVRFKLQKATPPSSENKSTDRISLMAQEMPLFYGCEEAGTWQEKKKCSDTKMLEFIRNNLQYPAEAKANKIEGMVMISFVVEKNGTITDPKILRDLGGGCGEEAIRIAESMPKWTPAKQRNEPVRLLLNLPVRFKLKG